MQPNLLLVISFILFCNLNREFNGDHNNYLLHNSSSKHEAIKLYPNPSYDGKISISTNRTDTLHFYIFDLEGTLINQTVLTNKAQKTITDLNKGTYIYDVFEKDESIEEGKIIVK
ncbi:MAG TPA: T9SS type A sorting domain-containing protein [Flavisolibacter sp.]|jgi:hypothetical protein|nr:T9SS type A sorting domain-containing protein [Flavisolibacter sp.]